MTISNGDSRFLHIVPDDKFIDAARALFEGVAPGTHDYVLLRSRGSLRYIRTFEPRRRTLAQMISGKGLETLAKFEAVFVHYLNSASRRVVREAPPGVRMVWLGWGNDYYHLIARREDLLLPSTRELAARLRRLDGPSRLTARMRRLFAGSLDPFELVCLAKGYSSDRASRPGGERELVLLNRFKLFAPVLKDDYLRIARSNTGFRPAFADWNYYTPGFGDWSLPHCKPGGNILLGNSATAENNHLEMIHALAGSQLAGRKVLCPLSYGDALYGDAIETAGSELLGTGFQPLREYISPEAYSSALQSCSIVAMNHVRQQAMGNILLMLWNGSHLLLNHRSPVFDHFHKLGIAVHDVRNLHHFVREEPAVSTDVVMDVRERLCHHYGWNALLGKTKALLEAASEKHTTGRLLDQ